MTDKTHQLIGLAGATVVLITYHPDISITWPVAGTVLLGSFLGSILPDIDQPTSDVWDVVPLGNLAGKVTSRALGGHRNLSHSILGIILFGLLAFWLADKFFVGELFQQLFFESFMIGYIGHLAADSVTVMGIPVFWPFGPNIGFPPYPLDGLRIVTGKWFENLIIFPAALLLFVAFLLEHYKAFRTLLP